MNIEKYDNWLKDQEAEGIIYKNKHNVYISREFLEHERNPKYYNKIFGKFPNRTDKHPYMDTMLDLYHQFCQKCQVVLEIGGGAGIFANMIISAFQPKIYTVYEFSNLCEKIKKIKTKQTKLIPIKASCRFATMNKVYDVVIALETLEHITFDLEFIKNMNSNTLLIITLPRTIAPDHIRCFPVIESVKARYGKYLDILNIQPIYKRAHGALPKWWGVVAKRI